MMAFWALFNACAAGLNMFMFAEYGNPINIACAAISAIVAIGCFIAAAFE
jgi:hypothetical protein